MITIHAVTKKAGVSTTTVSHVCNNTRYVSDDLRQKVFNSGRSTSIYLPTISVVGFDNTWKELQSVAVQIVNGKTVHTWNQ